MGKLLSYTVLEEDGGTRLDTVLASRALYPSRSAAARAIERGCVFVNGAELPKKYEVVPGDTIVYEQEDVVETGSLTGQDIPLDIRYEDDDLIVLSKQVGLVCHPSEDHRDGTLVNALIFHCGADHLCNVQGEDDRLGIVHRLDQDTTGLMLAAKTDEVGQALMDAIRDRLVDRHYLALVHGRIAHDTGMIDAPLARAQDDRTRMAVRDGTGSREAVTTLQVLERFESGPKDNGYTLIDCKLFTGRTHQIRVHMEFAKHPLVGESVYCAGAPKNPACNLGLQRQFLHSFKLGFDHPTTGESMLFVDALPPDLKAALAQLETRSEGRTDAGNEVFKLMHSNSENTCDQSFREDSSTLPSW